MFLGLIDSILSPSLVDCDPTRLKRRRSGSWKYTMMNECVLYEVCDDDAMWNELAGGNLREVIEKSPFRLDHC